MIRASPQLGRPPGANGEQTRERIIVATMRCVAEVGYSQTTIRQIAKAADMTSASLYHYFPNKSELLEATVARIEEIVFPRLRAAALSGDDVVDRLGAVLDESDRLMREYPYLAAFERAIRAERAVDIHRNGGDRRGFTALRDIIRDVVADARSQGVLRGDIEPKAAVNAVYALTRGLTEQAAVLPPEAHRATLQSAKQLIRGTLFQRAPHAADTRREARS